MVYTEAMKRMLLVVCGLIGCTDSGEPQNGDVTIHYGSSTPKLDVGAAIQDSKVPGSMLVQIGSDEVNCDTDLDDFDFNGPTGTFVFSSVDKGPGVHASTSVSAMKVTSSSISIHGTSGMVTITAVEPRVTGTIMFTTTDQEVGEIAVAGSFDIKRCF
ncbi:hypothetical protein BH11MYX3_BH11MYX3_33630 [soil metagenome]